MHNKIIAALAFALVACLALTPGVQAASSSSVYVYLYDTGLDAPDAACDWYAKVDQPSYILTDGKTNLVLDVQMTAHNGTGAITDGTYTVRVTISDGNGTSVVKDVAINTAAATKGNITFAASSLAALGETDTGGVVTYQMLNGTGAVLDSYVFDDVTINDDSTTGTLFGLVPIIIGLLALTMVLAALGGMMGKMSSTFGKLGGRPKKK